MTPLGERFLGWLRIGPYIYRPGFNTSASYVDGVEGKVEGAVHEIAHAVCLWGRGPWNASAQRRNWTT